MNLPLCFLNPVVSMSSLKALHLPLNELEYLSIGDGVESLVWVQALLHHGANPHYIASIGTRPFPALFRQRPRFPIRKRGRALALRKTDHDRYIVVYITDGIPSVQCVVVRYVHLALDQVELVLQTDVPLFEHVGQTRPPSPSLRAQAYKPVAEQVLHDSTPLAGLPTLYTDLIETYRLPFKMGQRFPVNQDHEVVHIRQAKGRVFAVGNLTTAYYANPLDAKVAAQYTTEHILHNLLSCHAPHLMPHPAPSSRWVSKAKRGGHKMKLGDRRARL
ncbi:MAG: hypothetical protein ACOYLB_09065 [Phototrophicaceae bacterium]